MSNNSLSIIIPVSNEGENIRHTLSEMENKIRTPYNVFVVYDSPEDDTIPVLKEIMRSRTNITLIKNKYGGGVLNAIKTGFEAIETDVLLVVMADLSDDLTKVDEMFGKIDEGYDIVCGSRYSKGGLHIGGPRLKKLLSRAAGISLHYLIGIPTRDVTNSFKMYKQKVMNHLSIESNGGFEVGMEIVIKAFFEGYKIAEVPSIWRDRVAGESKFRLSKWLPKYLYWYQFALKKRFTGPKS